MVKFAETVRNEHKRELLLVALSGKGAFRRFKDTLMRTGLEDKWYVFKHLAYVELARAWCTDNGLAFVE